jgi:hypothetical protein
MKIYVMALALNTRAARTNLWMNKRGRYIIYTASEVYTKPLSLPMWRALTGCLNRNTPTDTMESGTMLQSKKRLLEQKQRHIKQTLRRMSVLRGVYKVRRRETLREIRRRLRLMEHNTRRRGRRLKLVTLANNLWWFTIGRDMNDETKTKEGDDT